MKKLLSKATTITISICALAFLLPAWAASWKQVAVDTNGSIFYIDKNSIEREGDVVTYWEKVVFKNLKRIPSENHYIKGSKVWYMLQHTGEVCGDKIYFYPMVQTIYYGLSGQVLYSDNMGLYSPSSPAPGTVGETIHNSICAPV